MEKILVINCGSSSLKFQLYNVDNGNYNVVSKGIAERIGQANSILKYQHTGSDKKEELINMPTHAEAIKDVLKCLLNGALQNL